MSDKTLTDASFADDTKVGFALIDFWASWCGPCKTMAPIIDEIAGEYANLAVFKADIEAAPRTARLVNVRSVPTFAILRDGKVIATRTGQAPKAVLKAWIDQAVDASQSSQAAAQAA